MRYQQPDDLDLAAEEAAEAARLSRLLPQLQDAAQREGGGGRGRRGTKGGEDDEVGYEKVVVQCVSFSVLALVCYFRWRCVSWSDRSLPRLPNVGPG